MTLHKNLTKVNYTPKNDVSRILYIVVHFTSNDGDTAKGNTQYFHAENRGASAHYFVDEREIWQCVEDGDIAWHCGTKGTYYHPKCRNDNSIGIEMCSRKKEDGIYYFKEGTMNHAVWLIKMLMAKYHVPIKNVIRHYDVTHKNCPEPFVREPEAWETFKNRLRDKEELTMSQYEELKNLISRITPKIYHYTKDVPEWGRKTVQKLLDKGYLAGASDSDLNLSEDALRVLVILDRAGIYDNGVK